MSGSLYDKYGGFPAVSSIVSDFYSRILRSPSLKGYFENVNMERLMDHQTKFICMALGGPNDYSGRSLEVSHQRLNITPEAFAEVGAHLKASLEKAGVESGDVNAIMQFVAGAQSQVVKRH